MVWKVEIIGLSLIAFFLRIAKLKEEALSLITSKWYLVN